MLIQAQRNRRHNSTPTQFFIADDRGAVL